MLLEPAWRGVDDPDRARSSRCSPATARCIVETECIYGCPIGSLALELHEPDPPVRERLAENFDAWTTAITLPRGRRRPPARGRRPPALAEFVLTTMEGAVMQARTYRDVAYFDRAVGAARAPLRRPDREAPYAAAGDSAPAITRKKEKAMSGIN